MKKRMPIAAQRVVTWRFGEGKDPRANTAIVSWFGPDAGLDSVVSTLLEWESFASKLRTRRRHKLKEKCHFSSFQGDAVFVPPLCGAWDEPTRLSAVMNPV